MRFQNRYSPTAVVVLLLVAASLWLLRSDSPTAFSAKAVRPSASEAVRPITAEAGAAAHFRTPPDAQNIETMDAGSTAATDLLELPRQWHHRLSAPRQADTDPERFGNSRPGTRVPQQQTDAVLPDATSAHDVGNPEWVAAPAAVLLRSISSQTARLEWEGSDAAGGFNLYICEDRSTYWSNCSSFDLDTNRAELAGLNPDSRYRLDIVAFGPHGHPSEASEVLYLETLRPGMEQVDIPDFETDAFLAVNSVCYNDCANTYAIMTTEGDHFDLAACSRKCEL